MSAVLDIPMQLALVLMLALGQPAPEQLEAATGGPVPATSPRDANPYAFSTDSWLEALAGLRSDERFARYSRRIFHTSAGEAYVPVAAERREILALKADPVIARHVAEHYAAANAKALAETLKRPVRIGDLYLAHRVGVRQATAFRQRLAISPDAIAATGVPEVAEAMSDLAFSGDRGRTFREVARAIDTSFQGQGTGSGSRSSGADATRVLGWQARVRQR